MPVRITPLHRALGLSDGELKDLLPMAVTQTLPEAEDLDWKRDLPHQQKPGASLELSTDLAAMANTSGGLIAYGVAEAPAELAGNGAGGFHDVVSTAAEVDQRLLQAGYQTQPPIRAMRVEHITLATGEHLYAVHVDASDDAPHLVLDPNKRDWFRAPIRHGAHTQYMTERQLEQAYAGRFNAISRRQDALADLGRQCQSHFDLRHRPLLVATAVPRRPRPSWAVTPTQHEARDLFQLASRLPVPPFPGNLQMLQLLPSGSNMRVGLRRWVDRYEGARAEIHHDGSVACAFQLRTMTGMHPGHLNPAPDHEVASVLIEGLACEFSALFHSVGLRLRIDSYDVRIDIRWDGPEPVQVRSDDPMGRRRPVDPADGVRAFVPVLTTVRVSDDDQIRVQDASQLAEDLLAQAGVEPSAL